VARWFLVQLLTPESELPIRGDSALPALLHYRPREERKRERRKRHGAGVFICMVQPRMCGATRSRPRRGEKEKEDAPPVWSGGQKARGDSRVPPLFSTPIAGEKKGRRRKTGRSRCPASTSRANGGYEAAETLLARRGGERRGRGDALAATCGRPACV